MCYTDTESNINKHTTQSLKLWPQLIIPIERLSLSILTAKEKSATMCNEQLNKSKLKEKKFNKYSKKDSKRFSMFKQTPRKAVYIHASSHLQQQTRIQIHLSTI